jgi:hypothetical protein
VAATAQRERVGFGDEIWRLGREGDAAGLHRAADLLTDADDGGHPDYDAHRARAFALAIDGRADDALAALSEGWTAEWPFPAAFATDNARVRFLAGEYEAALDALKLAVHGVERHLDGSVAELTVACVERAPRVWTKALKVATSGGTARQQLSLTLAVLRARF